MALSTARSLTPRIVFPALLLLAALVLPAGRSRADTCSYNWNCQGSSACAALMGGMSGTKSASGTTTLYAPGSGAAETVPVTKQNCDQARINMNATSYTTPCVCTSGGSAAADNGFQLKSTGSPAADLVNDGAQMWILQNIKNPYTAAFAQNFTQSFLTSYVAGEKQREAIQAQIQQQQEQQAELAREAEKKRIDDMFARLNSELKLSGDDTDLSLKTTAVNDALQMKLSGSSSSDQLQFKTDDQPASGSSQGYGIKGLTGIYTGGPAPDDNPGGLEMKLSNDAPGTTPPASAGNQIGIPGLPGINLNDLPPAQAPQVAAAAIVMTGPEQPVAEDAALQAAEKNPALTAPTDDPVVQDLQQQMKVYDGAVKEQQAALQQASEAQGHVQADQAAISYANNVVQSGTATDAQKQAFAQMQVAEGSDEAMAAAARQQFDTAEIHISIARNNAVESLADLASPAPETSSSAATGSRLAHGSSYSPSNSDLPVLDPTAKPLLLRSAPAPDKPRVESIGDCLARTANLPPGSAIPTMDQLEKKLESEKTALERVEKSFDQDKEINEDWRKQWDHAFDELKQNAFDAAVDGLLSGTKDGVKEARDVVDKEVEIVTSQAQDVHQRLEKTRVAIANASGNPARLAELQRQFDTITQHEVAPLLERQHQLASLAGQVHAADDYWGSYTSIRDFASWLGDGEAPCKLINGSMDCTNLKKNNPIARTANLSAGQLLMDPTSAEGVKQVLDFAADNIEYLNKLKSFSPALAIAERANFIGDVWSGASLAIDTIYDVTAIYLSYRGLQQVKQNDAQFARARQSLDQRINQLNAEIGCYQKGGVSLAQLGP
jgi:hypothetical protein